MKAGTALLAQPKPGRVTQPYPESITQTQPHFRPQPQAQQPQQSQQAQRAQLTMPRPRTTPLVTPKAESFKVARKPGLTLLLAEAGWLWAGIATVIAIGLNPPSVQLLWLSIPVALFCVVGLYLADLYEITNVRRAAKFGERLPRMLAAALFLLITFYALVPEARLSTPLLAVSLGVGILVLLCSRVFFLSHAMRRAWPERVLILGAGPLVKRIAAAIDARTNHGHVVVAAVGDTRVGDSPAWRMGNQVLLDAWPLEAIVEHCCPERIVVVRDRRDSLPVQQLLQVRLKGIAVEDGNRFYERLTGTIALESLAPTSLAFGDGFGVARLHAACARAMGICAALIGFIVLAPFLALIALAIKIESAGPALFVQPRVGKDGQPFGLIKFRTMSTSRKNKSEWAADNGDRITRVGRWLRRFRIDELPQLLNVLRGEMNLVGPRPHPVSNYELFLKNIPYYELRSMVRPGITGWAQVRYGYANNLDEEIEKMRYDLFYIRNVSVLLDLRVLLHTAGAVARGQESVALHAHPKPVVSRAHAV
jgi:exopolysaccharide biosynthesis polyprenyl glycosylphosphotransferase